MMLLSNFIPPWVKWLAVAAVVAGIAGAGWWLNSRLERANEADALAAEMDDLRADMARAQAQAAKAAKDQAEAVAREAALAARIAGLPKERLVYVPKPIPGEPAPCGRLSADWMHAYNEAVTGSAR